MGYKQQYKSWPVIFMFKSYAIKSSLQVRAGEKTKLWAAVQFSKAEQKNTHGIIDLFRVYDKA
jgi:hypothetical protein